MTELQQMLLKVDRQLSIRLINSISKLNKDLLSSPFFHNNIHKSSTLKIKYSFVNFPITSKYYHDHLPTQIEQCKLLAQKQQKLNEKCYLLQQIAQIAQNDPKLKNYNLDIWMAKQLQSWKGKTGRRDRVATVAYIIHKMKLQNKVKQLYEQIIDRIDDDQWYVDFDQAVKALQSYANYQNQEKRISVFQKIQRNIGISINDVNMTYYQRICTSLLEAGRTRSPLWQKIQKFVLRNLSMPYTPKTFFDIFKCFAISRNGSADFYQICQTVIQKGHLYNTLAQFKSNLGGYDSTGDYFALMIETYAVVQKYTPISLSPDFLDYIFKSMMASKVEFRNITSLTKIMKKMPQIGFHESEIKKVTNYVINNKQFSDYHSLIDVQQLFFTCENVLGSVPPKLVSKIQNLILKDLNRNLLPLPRAIQIVDFMLLYRYYQLSVALVDGLNESIAKKYKYISVEQKNHVKQMINSNRILQQKIQKVHFLPKPKKSIEDI